MLHVQFDDKELPELRKVLDRAMNTWEPADRPAWLGPLSDRVDSAMGRLPTEQAVPRYVEIPSHRG